jgi:hypothetical protein
MAFDQVRAQRDQVMASLPPDACKTLEGWVEIMGGYRVIEKLGQTGYYIDTFRARSPSGSEMVVKFHQTWTQDEDTLSRILNDQVKPLLPQLERLTSAAPARGLAPWSDFYFYAPRFFLLLARPYYPTRLLDRFPIPQPGAAPSEPEPALFHAFEDLAAGLDDLCRLPNGRLPCHFYPDNLFLDGDHAILADYGQYRLHHIIENGYDGPRPGSIDGHLAGLCWFVGEEKGSDKIPGDAAGRAQFCLAMLYLLLRTGQHLFMSPGEKDIIRVVNAFDRYRLFYQDGRLDIGPLQGLRSAREREAVEHALSLKPALRFPSATAFVRSLRE